jgi:hypothetical protein
MTSLTLCSNLSGVGAIADSSKRPGWSQINPVKEIEIDSVVWDGFTPLLFAGRDKIAKRRMAKNLARRWLAFGRLALS